VKTWGCGGTSPPFLTSALNGCVFSFTPLPIYLLGKDPPGAHCTRGWVGPGVGINDIDNRNISYSYGESNPNSSPVHPIARRYTDLAIMSYHYIKKVRTATMLVPFIIKSGKYKEGLIIGVTTFIPRFKKTARCNLIEGADGHIRVAKKKELILSLLSMCFSAVLRFG
jgi:hypothetical protein